MEKLPQELVDKIIDHVDHGDLLACSLVETRWVEPSHRRRWRNGCCSFTARWSLRPWRASLLLLNHSAILNRIHTLALSSTAVEGWADYFDTVDVVFPNLKALTLASPSSGYSHYAPVLKRQFGKTLESLTLCVVDMAIDELYAILASLPNLTDLKILHSSPASVRPRTLPLPEYPHADLRTQGKLSLVGIDTQDLYVPFFATLPQLRYSSLYLYDGSQLNVGITNQLVSACSSTLETLEIRDGPVYIDTSHEAITSTPRDYPELRTIQYTLPDPEISRGPVEMMLSSIASAPQLAEVSFNFVQMELGGDLDGSGLDGWTLIDAELCRLAQQAVGRLTVSFDFLTKPGWNLKRDATKMNSMSKFRPFGVMIVRCSGQEKAVFRG